MNHRMLTALPLLLALLACRNGPKTGQTTSATAEPGAAVFNRGAPAPNAAARKAAPSVAAGTAQGAAPATAAATAPDPAPAPGPAVALPVVIGHARTDNGFVKIPGEIHNNTQTWMRFVQAHITLLDASGKPIGVHSVSAAAGLDEGVFSDRSLVPPGKVAPFEYVRELTELARPYASFKVRADGVPTKTSMGATAKDVSISHDDLGAYTVTGSVVATGSAGCHSPHAIIGEFAQDGKLWEVDDTNIDAWFLKVMPTGQSVAFKHAAIQDDGGKVTKLEVWADCEL